MYPPRKRQSIETVETTPAVNTKEEMNMTTNNTTSLVQAILASPELEATLIQLINKLQAPATIAQEALQAPVAPMTTQESTPAQQERTAAPEAPLTRDRRPQAPRNPSVGLIRGTDNFKSFPLEGVMSPRKENIQAMVLEMAKQVVAMYNGGMRTLFTVLFPGAELLMVNVLALLKENNRCMDLKLVGLDSKTFQNIRMSRVHTARVFDDSRYESFKTEHEIIWFDRNKDMTTFLKDQNLGHFLMVSDKEINDNLKGFFVKQREMGTLAYYVSPAQFASLWDFKNPDPKGPNGGGAPAPKAETAPAPEQPVAQYATSLFEGLLPGASSATVPVEASTPVMTVEAPVESVVEEPVIEAPAAPAVEEQPPVLLGNAGISLPDNMFGDAPLSSMMPNPVAVGQPVQFNMPSVATVVTPPVVQQTEVVAPQVDTSASMTEHVFTHLTRREEVIDRKTALMDIVMHYNVGDMIDPALANTTMHDFALASVAYAVRQSNGLLDLNDVFRFFLKLSRYQCSEYKDFSVDSCSQFTMENPYEYFLNASGLEENSQLFTLVCSCIEALEQDHISMAMEKDAREYADGPSLSTPAPSFI